MTRGRKTNPRAGGLRDSANVGTDQGSNETKHSAESAESLVRIGVTLALAGMDAHALLTDDPAPGMVEAADCISEAADCLSLGGAP